MMAREHIGRDSGDDDRGPLHGAADDVLVERALAGTAPGASSRVAEASTLGGSGHGD
jgi:hypothetical protein